MKPALLILSGLLLLITFSPAHAAPRSTRRKATGRVAPWKDRGVDIGVVKTATTLFSAPDAASLKIAPLHKGDWTALIPGKQAGEWCTVIAVASGRQGWVKSHYLDIHPTRHPNPAANPVIGSTGGSGSPVLQVYNDTDDPMYLHIESRPELRLPARARRDVTVTSGIWQFNAAVPGVIPLFGSKAWINGDTYNWHFYIGDVGVGRRTRVSSTEKKAVQQLQTTVNQMDAELKPKSQALDLQKAALEVRESKLKAAQEALDADRATLDHTDSDAVAAFNKRVDDLNAEKDACGLEEEQYDAQAAAYNAEVETYQAKRRELEARTDRINAVR